MPTFSYSVPTRHAERGFAALWKYASSSSVFGVRDISSDVLSERWRNHALLRDDRRNQIVFGHVERGIQYTNAARRDGAPDDMRDLARIALLDRNLGAGGALGIDRRGGRRNIKGNIVDRKSVV